MRLSYRSADNTLRLTLDVEQGPVDRVAEAQGTLDIGEQGRLVGIEVAANGLPLEAIMDGWRKDAVASRYVQIDGGTAYVALSAPGEAFTSEHVRSAAVRLWIEIDERGYLVAITVPRRGHGYEISFPSGNR
jgi:uncharacterized protein YuzE